MQLLTKHFGEITIDETKIIEFPHGIPGFPDDKKFILITDIDSAQNLYCWLQSISDGNTALVLVDSFTAMPKYDPLVNQEELEELGEVDLSDIVVFNVAVIGSPFNESTINLKAPVIINERTKKGKQVIANNDEYTIRHNLVEILKSQGEV